LEEAHKVKLEVLSITDHDTLKAYKELTDYEKIFKGKLLTGIELNTVYNGISIHMLGYDFDYNKLIKWVEENYEKKTPDLNAEFQFMIQNCKKNKYIKGNIVKLY